MRVTHKTYSLQRAKLKAPEHKSSILILTLNTHYNNQYTVINVYKQQHNNHLTTSVATREITVPATSSNFPQNPETQEDCYTVDSFHPNASMYWLEV